MERSHLFIGVGQVTLLIRHSRSLKDKRHVLKSAITKLRNEGFSVVECGYQDDTRRAMVGFSYAGKEASHIEKLLDDAFRTFELGSEIVQTERDVYDYTETKESEEFKPLPNERWDGEDDV